MFFWSSDFERYDVRVNGTIYGMLEYGSLGAHACVLGLKTIKINELTLR